MLEAGVTAPDFNLLDKNGNVVHLKDFKGKKVILYFYPKDSTPGCTKQACGFRDNNSEYEKLNAVVIGISKDSVKSHMNFASKQELNFTILSDTELEVIKAYDVWQEKKNYGKVSMGVVRTTYIIDENGIIEKVFNKVKTSDNPAEVLEYLKNNN